MTVLLTPVHATAMAVFLLGSGRFDAGGQGGPFRACTADSAVCEGPGVVLMTGSALVVAAGVALAAWAGRRAGGFSRRRPAGFLA